MRHIATNQGAHVSKRKMTPAQRAAARRTPEQQRAIRERQRGKRGTRSDAGQQLSQERELEAERVQAAQDRSTRPAVHDPLSKKVFTFMEIVLVCYPFIVIGASDGGAFTLDAAQFLAPDVLRSTISNLAQVLAAGMMLWTQQFYLRGETGRAAGNLIVMLVAELLFQNVVGVVCVALVLWRVISASPRGLGHWYADRGMAGMAVDVVPGALFLVPSLVYMIVAVIGL